MSTNPITYVYYQYYGTRKLYVQCPAEQYILQELLENPNKKFDVDLFNCGYLQCLSINILRNCLYKK